MIRGPAKKYKSSSLNTQTLKNELYNKNDRETLEPFLTNYQKALTDALAPRY